MVALAAMFMTPILFILLTSLMTDRQTLTSSIWPAPFSWGNYAKVLETIPFFRYTFNTFTIAFLATVEPNFMSGQDFKIDGYQWVP